ncbi:MAG: DUF3139 domain-containing protein [Firmicutes bacterium]|nr:DUF3139 domain-containing protein [Bacillota bacterium]
MKTKIVLGLILFSLLLVITSLFTYSQHLDRQEHIRYTATYDYLTTGKNYNTDEIYRIDVKFSLENLFFGYPQWTIAVTFNDEPNVNYYYQYADGRISQGGLSGSTPNNIYTHVEGAENGLDKN